MSGVCDRAEKDLGAPQLDVTPAMARAGLLEFEARFPDVVFSKGDGERFVSQVFLSMLQAHLQAGS